MDNNGKQRDPAYVRLADLGHRAERLLERLEETLREIATLADAIEAEGDREEDLPF